jgi:histidinol-phosphate aminotransferase
MVEERERMLGKLRQLDFLKPIPSHANFILCEVTRGNAKYLQDELEKQGILIRYYNTPLLQNYIRISAGKPEQTDKIINALRKIGENN